MNPEILKKIEADQYKNRPDVQVGDRVRLHMWIKEGGKQRIQVFEGNVIAISGTGLSKTLTVRKISYGVGVERIIPLHSPNLEKIEITKRGKARSSKLYFIRERVGRMAMRVAGHKDVYMTDEEVKEAESEDSATAAEGAEVAEAPVEAEATEEKAEEKSEAVEEKTEEKSAEVKEEAKADKE
ncbi:MAG: 50S ribosomal protein L19 [Candidatus Dojkabacteria bacterium]|nr:MAG: 50S ribosomal protein L19 [Candidatus Dojkabacteria bacterium]